MKETEKLGISKGRIVGERNRRRTEDEQKTKQAERAKERGGRD